MNNLFADIATTAAGGSTGLALLATVNWASFPAPWGEVTKIVVALAFIVLGYKAYSKPPSPPPPPPPVVDSPTTK